MPLKILCIVKFNDTESASIDKVAASMGVSREEAIRHAVKIFSAKCVPTHKKSKLVKR